MEVDFETMVEQSRDIAVDTQVSRSRCVSIARFGDGAAALDTGSGTCHILAPLAAWLLADEAVTSVSTLAHEFSATTGTEWVESLDLILQVSRQLLALGLINRDTMPPTPSRLTGSSRTPATYHVGRTHAVLDHSVVFRSSDPHLVHDVDAFLGTALDERPPSVTLDIEPTLEGGVSLWGDDEWRFPSRESFFDQLIEVLNIYARASESLLVFCGGAVLTPDGRMILVLGQTHAAASLVVAELVRSGCEVVSAELTGVRSETLSAVAYSTRIKTDTPLGTALDPDSQHGTWLPVEDLRPTAHRLVGDIGPVGEIIFPAFHPGADTSAIRLAPSEALKALLDVATNLARTGDEGLATICALGEGVPVTRVQFDDPTALAAALVENSIDVHVEATKQERAALDDVALRRARDAMFVPINLGEPAGLLLRPNHPTLGLDPSSARVWQALSHEQAVSRVVDAAPTPGTDTETSREIAICHLDAFARHGLISAPAGLRVNHRVLDKASEVGEWSTSSRWLHNALPVEPMKLPHAADYRWPAGTIRTRWGNLHITSDCAPVNQVLVDLVDPYEGTATHDDSHALTVELKQLPGEGSGAMLRIGGLSTSWLAPGGELAAIATMLASELLGDSQGLPLAEVWVLEDGERTAIHVGDPVDISGLDGALKWERKLGTRIDNGTVLWVADPTHAVDWVTTGASRRTCSQVWNRRQLVAIGVPGAVTRFDGYAKVVDSLLVSQADTNRLHHLLAGGIPALMIDDPLLDCVSVRIREALNLIPQRPAGGHASPPSSDTSSPVGRSSGLEHIEQWAKKLGTVTIADQSVKVDRFGVTLPRPLLSVQCRPNPDRDRTVLLAKSLTELGMTERFAEQAAAAAWDVHGFHLGEEPHGNDSWRRKFYVDNPTPTTWSALSRSWPTELIGSRSAPTWISWKWDSSPPRSVTRSVAFGCLAGAESVGVGVESMLDAMGDGWVEVIHHMMNRVGLDLDDRPRRYDAITLDEDGRRAVDLSIAGRRSRQAPGIFEGELRWISGLCGNPQSATDDLVNWAAGGRITNLVIGLDQADTPFVNVYRRDACNPCRERSRRGSAL